MSNRLPPLTALRAFDAAARHLSFRDAAAELSVTPAALSFQIKSLEDHLGAKLFHRLNRAVELTDAGRALAPGAEQGFAALTDAWRRARRAAQGPVLTVTAGPGFTAAWLAPRLFGFVTDHPGIEMRLLASLSFADLRRGDADVAIRFSETAPAELHAEPLMSDWMTPMMTPALAQRFATPGALASAPLIHQEDDLSFTEAICDWPTWFRTAGVARADTSGAHYSHSNHAIEAAASGAGVVLGRVSLTAQHLADGRLVAPFPLALRTRASFRLLCAPDQRDSPAVVAFFDWLRAQVATVRQFDAGRDIRDP